MSAAKDELGSFEAPRDEDAPRIDNPTNKLRALRRELGARKGWGLIYTYARTTVYQREDGNECVIAVVYASRTGEQGRAHHCVSGTGATEADAINDLAAHAAELPRDA